MGQNSYLPSPIRSRLSQGVCRTRGSLRERVYLLEVLQVPRRGISRDRKWHQIRDQNLEDLRGSEAEAKDAVKVIDQGECGSDKESGLAGRPQNVPVLAMMQQ